MDSRFQLDSYQFDLPPELIAQHPCEKRDQSRLLIVDRKDGSIREEGFTSFPSFLESGDSLILNNTKVLPARLLGRRESGGQVELLLLKAKEGSTWEVMAKPARKLKPGTRMSFGPDLTGTVTAIGDNGHRLVEFASPRPFLEVLHEVGQMPLPPYIERETALDGDKDRYQTVFAQKPGAVAAPTAGLHFTESMLEELKAKGISQHFLTLHVGAGTFKPVQSDDIRQHDMHYEAYELSEETANALNKRDAERRQVVVGTTCCRTLESAADQNGILHPGCEETNLFIYPGYEFRYVRSLFTNFHLPGSTLFMLVCTLAGHDLAHEAYAKAIEKRFRFFSYGDAMWII